MFDIKFTNHKSAHDNHYAYSKLKKHPTNFKLMFLNYYAVQSLSHQHYFITVIAKHFHYTNFKLLILNYTVQLHFLVSFGCKQFTIVFSCSSMSLSSKPQT